MFQLVHDLINPWSKDKS